MTILTWNASLSGILDKNKMEGIIEQYRLPGMVLRDDPDYARHLLDKFPWFTVVLRLPWPEWHERRDDMIQEDTVDNFITFLEGKHLPWTPDHRLRYYVGNELATNAKVAAWLTECVNAFAAKGWPGDFGHFAVGNPPNETWDWVNVFPDYVRALSEHRDLMRSGHHEYFETFPFQTNFPYRVGRTTFLKEAQNDLGIPEERRVREMVSECGWDSPSWRARGISQADYLMQLAYATDVVWVPAGIEMAAVFHYGANDHSEGGRWEPYDIENTSLPLSIASRKDTAMPDYQPAQAIPSYPSGAVVRDRPTKMGKWVDNIRPSSPPRVVLAVLEPSAWLPVERNSAGEVYPDDDKDLRWIPVHITEIPTDGYVREDVITLRATTPQPPTPPAEDDWEAKYHAEVEAHEFTQVQLELALTQRDHMTETFNSLIGELEQLRIASKALLVQVTDSNDRLFGVLLDYEEDAVEPEGTLLEEREPETSQGEADG